MKRKNVTIVWLLMFIFIIVVVVSLSTYAYRNFKIHYDGSFDIEVNSKGVDVLTFNGKDDVYIKAHVNNFAPVIGHDLKGTAEIEVDLETTNPSAEYCYEMYMILPDTVIFEYSDGKTPELLLNVRRTFDGKKYDSIISDMDITQSTGIIKLPTIKGGSEYLNKISVKKRQRKIHRWEAELTLVYLKDIDQTINDNKTYKATLEAKRVECK